MNTRAKKFSMSDKNMDAVVKSLESIKKEVTKTNTSLKSLSKDVTEIRSELDMLKDLKHSLEFIQSKVTELDNSVTDHTEKIGKIEHRINQNEKNYNQLNENYLQLDSYIRRENLKFCGIPEERNENPYQTANKVRNIFKNKLQIEDSSQIDFQRCHRMGPRPKTYHKSQKPRDIIIKFAFFPDRDEVWNQRYLLQGSNISMQEDYPREIFHLNICHIVNKLDELKSTLLSESPRIDVLGFTETFLTSLTDDNNLNVEGYNLYRRDRKFQRGGGIIVYVSDKWNTYR